MADELVPDEVVDSSPIDGSGADLPPDMFPPVDHWSEADPNYEDIPTAEPEEDDEEEGVPEEDEEPYGGHEDADPLRPYWVRYELHGRNLDSGEGWEALATADFNGDFEVAIEHLTAGARWEFRLRLIDRDGRPSKWSEPLQITLPTDFTPPPAPTAPIISNVHGYTTMTWDGELTGERPEDFSHIVAYVRQMHPEGDPDGEPGDPRRVGTLSGRGDFPLLQFLGGVLHEAHFTAVDTSGNESPWSDTVEFTPTPPVDAAAIEQELEEARQRLEQAEADFAEGNEQRRLEIEDLRDNVIPGLESALSGLSHAVEDYDDRITSAQEGADSARATAEDLRDNVLPPLEADLTDLRDNRLPAAEDTLDQTRLGMENLRDVRLPELQDALNSGLEDANEWREVGAISATSLRVGSWGDNMILDPEFNDPDYWLANSTPSRAFSFGNYTRDGVKRRVAHVNVESVAGQTDLTTPPFPCEAGQEYLLEFIMETAGSINPDRPSPSHWCRIRWRDQDNNYLRFSNEMIVEPVTDTTWTASELVAKAPEGAHYFQVVWRFYGPHRGNTYRVASPRLRRRADANLLVDGAVQARHIIAEEVAGAVAEFLHISADQIDTDDLAAHLATIIELDAGQITAGKIDTSRLNAQEVAGAVANFLTLDALEINVEQLAGEIGQFLEITAENLAAGAISTKHLSIGNFENLWPDDWYGSGASPDYVYATNALASNSVSLARFNDPNPPAPVDWTPGSRLHGRRRWAIPGSAGNQSIAFRMGPGRGITVSPGEQYALTTWVRDMSNSGTLAWHINFFTLDGQQGSSGTERVVLDLSGTVHGADNTTGLTHSFTVPDLGWGTMYMVPFLRHEPGGYTGSGYRSVMEPRLRKMVDGELLVDGAVTSRKVNTQEFFSSSAVIDRLSVATARAMEITAERGFIGGALLENNSITADKIVVTEELVGRFAQFLVVEADMLAANAIDGMTINGAVINGGVFEAKMGGNVTARLSRDSKRAIDTLVTPNGVEEREVTASSVSHLSFYVNNVSASPGIWRSISMDGVEGLTISAGSYTTEQVPGTGSSWGEVRISGARLRAPRTEAGHLHAETVSVTPGGMVGTPAEFQIRGFRWEGREDVGSDTPTYSWSKPYAVQMGRIVFIGGAFTIDSSAVSGTWAHPNRFIAGFPPPSRNRRFLVPLVDGRPEDNPTSDGRWGVLRNQLVFEIDTNGVGRFVGYEANNYSGSWIARLEGMSYVTDPDGAPQAYSAPMQARAMSAPLSTEPDSDAGASSEPLRAEGVKWTAAGRPELS